MAHEKVANIIRLAVHIVPPSSRHPWYTLVTSGMSDLPMHTPPEVAHFRYMELLICLPPTWPMQLSDWHDEANYWPISLLKTLARLPHTYDTWLGHGHTMPNGDPPEPFSAATKLAGALIVPQVRLPDAFDHLDVRPEKIIHFYAVMPLYREEMQLKRTKGSPVPKDNIRMRRRPY